MTFHIQFVYAPSNHERLVRLLHQGGLDTTGAVKIRQSWLAVQTGIGYALAESDDAAKLYQACSVWSEYGQLTVTPVVSIDDL